MITPESTDTALDASQSTRSWVWHSTDDSIAAGQISVLSVVETFCALGLYGWLAFHFEHQWWLLISAVAAPIILLRSPKSKALGVKWLQQYWLKDEDEWKEYTFPEKLIFIVFPYIIVILIGWLLIKTTNNQYILFSFALLAGGLASAVSGIGKTTQAFLKMRKTKSFFMLFMLTIFFATAVWLRSLIIRFFATLTHLGIGFRNLPINWKETLAIVDFTHPPELLPGAKAVDNKLTVRGLLNQVQSTTNADHWWSALTVLVWYPPAILWRWSLKATLWLWFPLALLLRPPFEGKSLEQVRDIAAIRVVASKWLGFVALLGILLLAVGYIPSVQAWVDTLGDSISKPFTKLAEFHLPPPGLRQWALWLCCGLAGLEWLSLVLLQARHKKLLEEEDSIYGGIPEIRLQTFLQRVRKVQWLHTALVVSFILLGYTIVLHLANTWYPAELARFIPAWLIGWL